MSIFSDDIRSGDILRADTYQHLLNFARGSSVAGGMVSANGISVPSEYERSPRTVRFIAEEDIQSYSIIELTEQVDYGKDENNVVPTFKAKPATGHSGTFFYTATSFACAGDSGIAYSIGGEPILIRSNDEADGSPIEGKIGANAEGVFRYLGKSVSPDLRWFLPMLGGNGGGTPTVPKVRLVQPKELFPACEYRKEQDVFDCLLEYSNDGVDWQLFGAFSVFDGMTDMPEFYPSWEGSIEEILEYLYTLPRYWRIDLSGFATRNHVDEEGKEDSFARLWEAIFCINRLEITEKTVDGTNYIFAASITNWQINGTSAVPVEILMTPTPPEGSVLLYKPSADKDWRTFNGSIPTEDLLIGIVEEVNEETGKVTYKERNNRAFHFQVVTFKPDTDDEGNIIKDKYGNDVFIVDKEYGSLTVKRPAYKLSPERPPSLTVLERTEVAQAQINGVDYTFTAKPQTTWESGQMHVSVKLTISPSVKDVMLLYSADGSIVWEDLGDISHERMVSIPEEDLQNPYNTGFWFAAASDVGQIMVFVPKPSYPISSEFAEVALPPPRADLSIPDKMYFSGMPVHRNTKAKRYWMLEFDDPEVVTYIGLNVARHYEHYIVCPGGREEREGLKTARAFIDTFDLVSEQWTATTFPAMRTPMFNMDAKICEIGSPSEGETPFHNLLIMSGQTGDDGAYSGILQGFTLETGNILDTGSSPLSFAGRPVLWGGWDKQSPDYDNWYRDLGSSGNQDFSRHLMVLGGAERSTPITTSVSGQSNGIRYTSFLAIEPTSCEIKIVHETGNSGTGVTQITGYAGFGAGQWSVSLTMDIAGTVGTEIKKALTFARTQNFPVRGFRRKRPEGYNGYPRGNADGTKKSCVDFILIGGFNAYVDRNNNTSVVSAMLGRTYASGNATLVTNLKANFLTQNQTPTSSAQVDNGNWFFTYPDSPVVLGDCCAEHYVDEDRDEIITFGGRLDFNTAIPHSKLYVLDFTQTTNRRTPGQSQSLDLEGAWVENKYPPMPHPRYAAASVLIHDLDRNDGFGACDRIFVIGGRDAQGLVPETDVFNLRYNEWETDWRGLDEGELETYTPPGGVGGGTTIVINGGTNYRPIGNDKIDQIMQRHGF
ncbi:MAG: hypothetical protein LBI05_06460 [Planctomycetaceae bacterium]|jgi:hypothetical protein|nr:hypothetical protein [Planctomycetaceae bacterium]